MKNNINKYLKTDISSFISILIVIVFSFSTALAVKAICGNKDTKDSNHISISDIAKNKAEDYLFQGKYDKAISEYRKMQKDDKWPSYNVKIAEIQSMKGNIDESNRILEESLVTRYNLFDKYGKEKYKDKDAELCNNAIFTYLINGESDTAEEYGEMFMKEVTSNKLIRTMFTVYLINGKNDKAEKILDNYKVNVSSSEDLVDLGTMELISGRWNAGLENLKKAWYIDKNNINIYDVVDEFTSYDDNKCIKAIKKLAEDNNDEICYKIWLARYYSMDSKSVSQANKLMKEIEKNNISNIGIDLIKAKIYENSNEGQKALKIYNQIIKNKDYSYIGYHNEAWYYLSKGKYDKAFNLCKKSINSNKDYMNNYGFLIPEIMVKSDNKNVCEPYFTIALYKEPYNYNVILKIADYYNETRNNNSKAYKYFEMASKIKPDMSDIYYNMALIDLNQNKEDKSINLLNKCIRLNSSEVKYHRALGAIYMNKGKNSLALKEIRHAYSLDKNDIMTLNDAGCYYILKGNNIQRGFINIEAAYKGINYSTDEKTKKIITDNYNKAKNIYNTYKKNKGHGITIPKFELFY